MSRESQVALVTGAGRGIGRAIAVMLAQKGSDIIVNDMDSGSAEQTAEIIHSVGAKTLVSGANIVKRQEVQTMFDSIKNQFGRLDILVNNAGITRDNLLVKMTEEEWDQVMAVNLKGVFNCTQLAAKMMTEQNAGKIVNVSSASGQMGNIGQVNYATSKAGIIGMTKTLAKELARFNINVNAVAPGFINTSMTAQVPDKVKEMIKSSIPLNRFGESEDVARAVKFLVSEDSNYITGQVIACNGGLYI
ncbi:MAG: 3-oxoacyl-[acyl-carrier-protein] reductase [Planctomycetota bacterium]|jgi:3-oxoacyl-(acyl-carrier-protein) reductase